MPAECRLRGAVERREARATVATYHAARLADLIEHVGEAVDRFHAGELDAFEVDGVIFHYGRAAKELWKFCNVGDVALTAQLLGRATPSRLVGAGRAETTVMGTTRALSGSARD